MFHPQTSDSVSKRQRFPPLISVGFRAESSQSLAAEEFYCCHARSSFAFLAGGSSREKTLLIRRFPVRLLLPDYLSPAVGQRLSRLVIFRPSRHGSNVSTSLPPLSLLPVSGQLRPLLPCPKLLASGHQDGKSVRPGLAPCQSKQRVAKGKDQIQILVQGEGAKQARRQTSQLLLEKPTSAL
ncbi:hypothetical protein RRG08_038700 [Elysia crispata]|uniref:Uncharacterized protein n=1 Tax=Elysia crispata TaxID=231223 RepID=A0AAE1DGU7_9GAST|nr:hypothetical protein RRG08_038700 [Elysia crispata]